MTTNKQTNKQTNKETNKQTNKQTKNRQTNKQTNKQTTNQYLHFSVVEPIPLLHVFLVRHDSVVSTRERRPGGWQS